MSLGRFLPWVPLSLLFFAPFIDPRRPLRLLHLDLLVFFAFSALWLLILLEAFVAGWLIAGKVIVILGLIYLIGRMLAEGSRRRRRREPLIPLVPVRWLVVLLPAVLVFRAADVMVDQNPVIDVGGAGVIGAELITTGRGIYEGDISREVERGDTYGPVNYLAYIPFEQAIPLSDGDWGDSDAARVAPIFFDLLVVVALLLLGRQLQPGRDGRTLGIALAYAWATYPCTLWVLKFSYNDALLAALMLGALLLIASPLRSGMMLGLAAATKFVPFGVAPLFARGTDRWRGRSVALFLIGFTVVTLVVFAPFVPDGGVGEIYNRTVGFQTSGRCCSVWEEPPHLDLSWLEELALFAAAGLAIFVAVRRPPETVRQLAARAGAVMAAVVLAAPIWSPAYVLWFAPFALIAFLATDVDRIQAQDASRAIDDASLGCRVSRDTSGERGEPRPAA